MEIKPKKCKGTGKAKNFTGCGITSIRRNYGLCQTCYKTWLLTTPEGKEKMQNSIIRAKKKVEIKNKKIESQKKKEWKLKHKSIQALIQDARKVFHKFIRKRDEKKPCISCGTFYAEVFDAGHYFKAEIYSGLIFDEKNVHKQCRACNYFLSGNEANYRIGLLNRYGQDYVLSLEEISNKARQYKYSRQELIDIKNKYLKKIKEL